MKLFKQRDKRFEDALPITALERAELIATMFQPDGRKGREG